MINEILEYDEQYEIFLHKLGRHTEDELKEELERVNKMNNDRFQNECDILENEKDGYIKMELNIDKLDELWKYSKYYIQKDWNEIIDKAKYINSRRDILSGRVIELPYIEYNGIYIEVINGRNRLANYRDMGIKRIKVWLKYYDEWNLDDLRL